MYSAPIGKKTRLDYDIRLDSGIERKPKNYSGGTCSRNVTGSASELHNFQERVLYCAPLTSFCRVTDIWIPSSAILLITLEFFRYLKSFLLASFATNWTKNRVGRKLIWIQVTKVGHPCFYAISFILMKKVEWNVLLKCSIVARNIIVDC